MEILKRNGSRFKRLQVNNHEQILKYASSYKVEIKVHDLITAFKDIVPHCESDKKSHPGYLDGSRELPFVVRIRKYLKNHGYKTRSLSKKQFYSISKI